MDDSRYGRRAAEIARCASEFIAAHANRTPMITVTGATVGRDGNATVLVTVLPEEEQASALHFLNRHADEFRTYLKSRIRIKQLPRVTFAIDSGEKNRQRLDELTRADDTPAE